LKNNFFFYEYEDVLVKFRPICDKIRAWMKLLELYGVYGVGWEFNVPIPCLIVYQYKDDGTVLELDRRHYDKENNTIGDRVDIVKRQLGSPGDFSLHVCFVNVDEEMSRKIFALKDEFRDFFLTFSKEEISLLYDIDSKKMEKIAREKNNSLTYSGLMSL